jgi:two-component system, OmpR family, sensor kinase
LTLHPPSLRQRLTGRRLAGLRPRPFGGWTLRARLVAALVAVLLVVCLVLGSVTVLALRSFLVGQLDDRLGAASHRAATYQDNPSGSDDTGANGGTPGSGPGGGQGRPRDGLPPGLLAPGQGAGTFAAQVSGGTILAAGILDESGNPVAVTSTAITTALLSIPAGDRPRTVELPGLGAYRVVAADDPDGDGSTLVTGLPMAPVTSTVYRLALTITLVALGGVVIAAFLVLFVVRLSLRPLHRVASAARSVAGLPLDTGEVEVPVRVPAPDTDPHTEVGQVGSALNHMIGHVENALAARQASEMKVRHFVADASHELRTPLAAIRGYAELTRPQREDAPPHMAYAMERVESAAERMSSLVEDLLLLARLDTGRPIETEPVDLSELVIDAVSDAHAVAPDHTWQLDLPEDPVQVDGDRLQLHQVVANLLANARTHTAPGTTVSVSLRHLDSNGGGIEIAVHDNGPGIPESLRPNVFERFARGDSSRSRAAGSSGLGLAIVSSVVAAHRGHVGLSSEPGDTRFTVWLPPQQPARAVTVGA